jgi:glycosyltransferase involved in cell wall biosynthesis
MQQKTILFVIPSLEVGGAENQLSMVLPGLKGLGWDVTVFLTSGLGSLAAPLQKQGIRIVAPQFLPARRLIKSKLLRSPFLLLSFCQLTLYLLIKRPKIVHFTLAEAYLLGGLSSLLVGQKTLIMSRRSLNFYQNKYPMLSKLEHWLHTKMHTIIANNQSTIEQLATLEHVAPQKLQLIYNGLDMRRFDGKQFNKAAIRQGYKLPNSSLTFIVIANILPYKGHATLLQALHSIKSHLPADWQLLCVGKKHSYCQELEAQAIDLELAQHVYFLGQQSAVENLLAISDVAISCSYEEGFSNSVIEAKAAGLPIIVTNVGGNPEAVKDGETGLVVQAKDPAALSAAILEVITNPAKAAKLANAGKQRVAENFSLQACIQNYNKLFLNTLNC